MPKNSLTRADIGLPGQKRGSGARVEVHACTRGKITRGYNADAVVA
jgi:hypothetical protein